MVSESSLTIDGISPARVERPVDSAEAAVLLRQAADDKCAVTPLGGGTMMELGRPVTRAELALSLEKLDHVVDHEPANLTVRTEAGITLGALNAALGRSGQMLPLDAPFPDRATVGGVLATNASGALRVRFGAARDLLIGLRVALPDGRILRGGADVVKNVAGYDLPKLFIGSLGTLGIIVEASLKIVPIPAHTRTLVTAFERIDEAMKLALRVWHSPLLPLSLVMLNPNACRRAGLGDRYGTLIRFGGLLSAVTEQMDTAKRWASEQGASALERIEADAEQWAILRDLVYRRRTVCKVGVRSTDLASVTGEAERIATEHGVVCEQAAQAMGILLMGLEGQDDGMIGALQAIRGLAVAHGGYLVIQQASRPVRQLVDAWGLSGADLSVMKKLKEQFDPNGILNPGRFLGGI